MFNALSAYACSSAGTAAMLSRFGVPIIQLLAQVAGITMSAHLVHIAAMQGLLTLFRRSAQAELLQCHQVQHRRAGVLSQ